MEQFSTPMMKQYQEVKAQYKDCLLFFRMGDFYELFLEDAFIGSKVLDITLTSRSKGKDGRIPMAGVPFHAVDPYISKLVRAGYKVAICEQVSEPNKYGIIDREVTRIITPGTVLDEKALENKENNFIISLSRGEKQLALACADITTGKLHVSQFELGNLEQIITNELTRLRPAECILSTHDYNNPLLLKILKKEKDLNIYCFQDWENFTENSRHFLKDHFGLATLKTLGIEDKKYALQAAAALIGYLKYTQKDKLGHFKTITLFSPEDYMALDSSTVANLELFTTLREREKQGSLLYTLDQTLTSMGGRMLRDWIRKPLINKSQIENRYNAVAYFLKSRTLRKEVRDLLVNVGDIERLLSRLTVGIGNARDMINLKNSLESIVEIKTKLQCDSVLIQRIELSLTSQLAEIIKKIRIFIVDEPPFDLKEGGLIKPGLHKRLDELRYVINHNKQWITDLEILEKKRTKISTLKIRYNQVFGFYIEISKSHLNSIPADYIRKQTLVNGERFITPALKEKEELILTAQEEIDRLEYEIYLNVLEFILEKTKGIQQGAEAVATLDCVLNFSYIAEKYEYCRPIINSDGEIMIEQGRHPVVERLLDDAPFVPNNVLLNNKDQQLHVITGPNMAGKSVFIRQVALIVLMAHIGSFVPAEGAKISLVDKIFVRSGASDVITAGLSTFMVEMVETAQILNNATSRSLIIMDEIGRGTSTYDGISLAWAIAEYLVTDVELRPKTLFATHYHELQSLENKYPQKIKNYHMLIQEAHEELVFLHTIKKGSASHSYGVAVAKLAGLPETVIKKASHILEEIEQGNFLKNKEKKSSPSGEKKMIDIIKKINPDTITPLQALQMLSDLKNKVDDNYG